MMLLPPTSRITRSGRSTPSEVVTEACSKKSHRSVMPASSMQRRSWSSPHRPRACGLRSALTSDGGLVAQCVAGLADEVDLLGQHPLRARALLLDLLELPLDLAERVGQRAAGLLEPLVGELEELACCCAAAPRWTSGRTCP